MDGMMYKNPKNDYERKMNETYAEMNEYFKKGFLMRLGTIARNLEIIYRKLPDELQDELAGNFNQLLDAIENSE